MMQLQIGSAWRGRWTCQARTCRSSLCLTLWLVALTSWLSAQSAAVHVTPLPPNGRGDGQAELNGAAKLIEQGRLPEAEAAVRSYLDSGKDGQRPHVLLGLIFYQEKKPADSLAEFTRAAKFARPGASELIVVGLDYVALRDLRSADRWLTMATQMDPESAAAWRYLGGIKYSENRFAEAVAAYGRSLQLRPRDVAVEDGIGRSQEGLSRDQEAEAAYRTALDWQQDAARLNPAPFLHLGALLAREGKSQAAIPLLTRAESLAPADSEVHEQLGEAWLSQDALAQAQSELERALALAPQNSHLHWLLASVYRREGKKEQAERETKVYASLLGTHSSDKLQ